MSDSNESVVQDTPKATDQVDTSASSVDSKPQETQVTNSADVNADKGAAAPAEVKPPEKVVSPDKYELKMPDGSQLNQAHIEKVTAYAKEKGLSNDQAQEILNRDSQAYSDFQVGQAEHIKSMQEKWIDDIKSDREFGGDKFNETVEFAKRSIEKFGSPALKEALNATGLGNHRDLIRMHAKIGREMANDKTVIPNSHGSGSEERVADILYPTMKQK